MSIEARIAPVAHIIGRTSEAWGLTPDDLYERGVGGNHKHWMPPVTVCRHVAMMIARDLLPETPWSELGLRFRRDPTTIRSNVRRARAYLAAHRLVGARVIVLKAEIGREIGLRDRASQTTEKGAVSAG